MVGVDALVAAQGARSGRERAVLKASSVRPSFGRSSIFRMYGVDSSMCRQLDIAISKTRGSLLKEPLKST